MQPHIFIPCLFLLECRKALGALQRGARLRPLCSSWQTEGPCSGAYFLQAFTTSLCCRGGGQQVNLLESLGFCPFPDATRTDLPLPHRPRDLCAKICSQRLQGNAQPPPPPFLFGKIMDSLKSHSQEREQCWRLLLGSLTRSQGGREITVSSSTRI